MEKWLFENVGTITTILSILGGFLVSYTKLRSRIGEVAKNLETTTAEVEKLRDSGLPILCRLHEERLTRMETEIKEHTMQIAHSVSEIKQMMAELIKNRAQ